MSYQRRHGQNVKVWKQEITLDRRGNRVVVPALTTEPFMVKAAIVPNRGNRAEVPGQQRVDVYSMIIRSDLEDVNMWSRVEWAGRLWDVIGPPMYHHGTRQTRHTTLLIRERPATGPGPGEIAA